MMKPHEIIRKLRCDMDLTVAQMAERLGLSSKGGFSMIENGKAPISQRLALAVETLTDGRIDAASLNAEIAAARAGFVRVADNENTTEGAPSVGADAGEGASEIGELQRLCFACERRLDLPGIRDCTAVDCPHAQREAA